MNRKQKKTERREARDHTEILGETTLHLACTDVGSINTGSDNATSRTTASECDAGSAGTGLIKTTAFEVVKMPVVGAAVITLPMPA